MRSSRRAAGVVLGDDNPITIGRTLADEERDLVAEGGLDAGRLAAIQRRGCRGRVHGRGRPGDAR